MTVFKPKKFRLWNSSIYAYATHRLSDGAIIGDKRNLDLTELAIKLGWRPELTEYDVLPLIIQTEGGHLPEMFPIPKQFVHEVQLAHPELPWFQELKLKWFAVPFISNMSLDMGGLEMDTCPFNGWFMSTEIARNLSEANRYNKLPLIAAKIGTKAPLWQDRAFLELNLAILYSFKRDGVQIVDHHRASELFMVHFANEIKTRSGCPSDWVWLVPPMSSSLTAVFHQEMVNYKLKPAFEYQNDVLKVWASERNKRLEKRKGLVSFKTFVK